MRRNGETRCSTSFDVVVLFWMHAEYWDAMVASEERKPMTCIYWKEVLRYIWFVIDWVIVVTMSVIAGGTKRGNDLVSD